MTEHHKQEVDTVKTEMLFLPSVGCIDTTDAGNLLCIHFCKHLMFNSSGYPNADSLSIDNSADESVSEYLKNQDQDSLYKAQLDEIREKLVKARKEGQEAAEIKTIGEIKSLKSQLGAKSK